MFEHLLGCHGEWAIFYGLMPSLSLVPYWFKVGAQELQNEETA